jgi:ribulose-phosphate 3-epimerase
MNWVYLPKLLRKAYLVGSEVILSMVTIIPAILSHNVQDFMNKLHAVEPYFKEAQIDFMDGVFVSNRSVTARELGGLNTPLKLEAHLMVQTPETWLQSVLFAGCRKIIIHQEVGASVPGTLRMIRSLGAEAGVAVNPGTDIGVLDLWWRWIGTVQVMGVNPGHYGARFQPAAIEKVQYLRERGFSGTIQVDGAVTPATAPILKRAGVNKLVVGHDFFGSEDNPILDKIGDKLQELTSAIGNA